MQRLNHLLLVGLQVDAGLQNSKSLLGEFLVLRRLVVADSLCQLGGVVGPDLLVDVVGFGRRPRSLQNSIVDRARSDAGRQLRREHLRFAGRLVGRIDRTEARILDGVSHVTSLRRSYSVRRDQAQAWRKDHSSAGHALPGASEASCS